jgi:hypothetical protein
MGIRVFFRHLFKKDPAKLPDPITLDFIIDALKENPMREVVGFSTNGCIANHLFKGCQSGHALAHAHNGQTDHHFGWICFNRTCRSKRDIFHEYGHILCPDRMHDAVWRATVTRLIGDCDDGTF